LVTGICVIGTMVTIFGGIAVASVTPGAGAPAVRHYGVVPYRTAPTTSGSVTPLALTPRPAAAAAGRANPNTVVFGGGVLGLDDTTPIGVVTGPPKVYLVFWGSQWGSSSTVRVQGHGTYRAFQGDPDGVAPDLQAFFSGLGTGNDGWSRVVTQYCQSGPGTPVAAGTATCPASAAHVSSPSGNVLAGIWEDPVAFSPTASASQLAQEAERAATHFGNTTPASNRNIDYVIVSPPGAHPAGFNTNNPQDDFCAWHDDSADNGINTPPNDGDVAFTNMPYVPDVGAGCGADAVNPTSPWGVDDGVTIIAGHEYAEWLSDPFPGGGWLNLTRGANYEDEIADECTWIPSGQGAMTDISLATGSFPVQSLWSNINGACETTSIAFTATPSHQRAAAGATIHPVKVPARDDEIGQVLRYTVVGLPTGLTINPHTGLISGHLSGRPGTDRARITVTDGIGIHSTRTIVWYVENDVVLTRPAPQGTPTHHAVRLPVRARDLLSHRTLRFFATGLPRGLLINAKTGVISGSTSATRRAYSVTLTVTDSGGARTTARFAWTVS